jgi:hypothetical protein
MWYSEVPITWLTMLSDFRYISDGHTLAVGRDLSQERRSAR